MTRLSLKVLLAGGIAFMLTMSVQGQAPEGAPPVAPKEAILMGKPGSPEALVSERKCFACHGRTEQQIGPPYEAIAMRWAGHDAAEDILTYKILKGGAGNWGYVPMVPNDNRVNEAEARSIAKWILALKPAE